MFYPQQEVPAKSQLFTQEWMGYNHNLRISDGEFWDMANMTGDEYPVLAPRKARKKKKTGDAPVRGMLVRDGHLLTVVGTSLYVDGDAAVSGFSLPSGGASETFPEYGPECPCKMVSMGAYVVFFPDKKYFNLLEYLDTSRPTEEVGDKGSLDAYVNISPTSNNTVTYEMCRRDGTVYTGVSSSAPESPTEGALWLDGSTLKTWSSGVWSEIPQVYIKISYPGIGGSFSQYDGVGLSINYFSFSDGFKLPESATIEAVENGFLVVPGIITGTHVQTAGQLYIDRRAPDMDYVVECGNRLWGCRYGYVFDHQLGASKVVNEIYASALGDFKNWNQFRGLSTDSYAASRGSQGPWTGAVAYQGRPIFFKAGCMETVYPSETGAHQIVTSDCRGCLPGSLAVVDEVLYYCTGREVVAFDGSYPRTVSKALGALSEAEACAGSLGHKYYLYLRSRGLLVLDTATGLWHREDDPGATYFAGDGMSLYFSAGADIWQPEGGGEEDFSWYAETGDIGLGEPGTKYISRLVLRFRLEVGAWVDVLVSYDSTGIWEHKGHLRGGCFLRSAALPIIPRRCDHMRIRIEGSGMVRIYSMGKQYEEGSDVF